MKTSFLIAVLIVIAYNSFGQMGYNRGFSTGYKKGYCYKKGIACIEPIPPIPPIPKIGEAMDSYQDGYNRGFEMGLQEGYSNDKQAYKTASAEPIDYMHKINLSDIYELANVLKAAKAKAFELSSAGNYQGCIDIAKAGLQVNPRDPEFIMLIGNGYLNLRNYSTALMYFKKAVKLNADVNLKEWISQIEDGTYQKQIEQSDTTFKSENLKDNIRDLKKQINQTLKDKNYIKALDLANKLIEQENSGKSYELRGYVEYLLQNYSESIADYTRAINIKPTPNTYFFRALCKEQLQDFYGVLSDYDKIIELGIPPDNNDMATIYNNKAYTLVRLKRYNDALPLVNKAIDLNSNQWFIWDTRGELYFQLGNYMKCIDDMTKAIELKPDQNSYYFRGLAKIKIGNKDGGCQDLSKSGELGNVNAYTEIKKNCQ